MSEHAGVSDSAARREAAVDRLMEMLSSLRTAREEIAKKEKAGEQKSADWLGDYVDGKIVEALEQAIELYTLTTEGGLPGADEIRAAELRLGVPEGSFTSCLGHQHSRPEQQGAAGLLDSLYWLRQVAKEAQARKAAGQPSARPRRLIPSVIRICVATAVGALVGAPLGAFLVHENIVKEMVKTAIATGVASTTAELIDPHSEKRQAPRADRPPAPTRVRSFYVQPDDDLRRLGTLNSADYSVSLSPTESVRLSSPATDREVGSTASQRFEPGEVPARGIEL